MSRVIILSLTIALSCSLAACAGGPVPSVDADGVVAVNDAPEYTTGSYIARNKKKAAPGEVKSLPPEQLEEAQRNSSLPMH